MEKIKYVCVEEMRPYWQPDHCMVVPCTDKDYPFAVVCNAVQTTIALGKTREDCSEFLRQYGV